MKNEPNMQTLDEVKRYCRTVGEGIVAAVAEASTGVMLYVGICNTGR